MIPHSNISQECKEQCKTRLIEFYGLTGSVSIIIAYILTSFDSDRFIIIDIFNLYGSSAVGFVCFRSKVWSATLLEVVWFGIASYSFIGHTMN